MKTALKYGLPFIAGVAAGIALVALAGVPRLGRIATIPRSA